jgi:exosortase
MHGAFASMCLLIAAIAWRSLLEWLRMSPDSAQSSSLWIIPLISAVLIYERRLAVFAHTQFVPIALVLFALGLGISATSFSAHCVSTHSDATALAIFGVVVSVAGAFLCCYGKDAWREAGFAIGFLFFAVPIPATTLAPLVRWLQGGSAAVVSFLFALLDVPYLRDGLRFYLSGLNIEIASECSGIRSSFALLVLSVLLSYVALRSAWRRLLVIATVVPLVLVKNGIRIVTLSLLTIRVDRGFISGSLHRQGGFVFFGIALAIEGLLCWILQRSEGKAQPSSR